MEPLTVTVAKVVHRHPLTATYLLAVVLMLALMGFHAW